MLSRKVWTKLDKRSDYLHDQGPINYIHLWAKSSHHLSSQINFYWNTITLIHLRIVYGYFRPTTAELSNFESLYGPQSQRYLLPGLLQKKIADPYSR